MKTIRRGLTAARPAEYSCGTPRARHAFTLVEILVVLAIITLLAMLLFPAFEAAQNNANRSVCQSNLKQLALGMQMYVSDYDGTYPPYRQEWDTGWSGGNVATLVSTVTNQWNAKGWATMIEPYTKNSELLQCPSAPATPSDIGYLAYPSSIKDQKFQKNPGGENYNAYFYNMNLGYRTGGWATGDPSPPVLVRESALSAASLTFLFGDGSLNGSEASYWGWGVGTAASAAHGGSMGTKTARNNAGLADEKYSSPQQAFTPYVGPASTTNQHPANSALRHLDGANYAFCDGHVKWLKPDQVTIRPVAARDFTFQIN
jgi:prepilin-type processing-associated H-X9-DG protein/prepilin-type N-terminal cleavage/methylation domain-containing protein